MNDLSACLTLAARFEYFKAGHEAPAFALALAGLFTASKAGLSGQALADHFQKIAPDYRLSHPMSTQMGFMRPGYEWGWQF